MGKITRKEKVKLFCGLIGRTEKTISQSINELKKKLGPVDIMSEAIPFSFTDYYKTEMGENLLRQWIGFEKLIPPEKLSEIKALSNKLEDGFTSGLKRMVNIDPGYLTLANVLLASTKDFSHRIYIGGGIYAEITLIYRHKEFTFLDWTYPDYKSVTALSFFEKLRNKYKAQIAKTL